MAIPRDHNRPWTATLDFGTHAHRTYAELVLTEPSCVRWMLSTFENAPQHKEELQFLKQTIEAFDQLPFQDDCQDTRDNAKCQNPADYATPNDQEQELILQCEDCVLRRHPVDTSLNHLRTYRDALDQSYQVDKEGNGDWLLHAFVRAKTGDLEFTPQNCQDYFELVHLFNRVC